MRIPLFLGDLVPPRQGGDGTRAPCCRLCTHTGTHVHVHGLPRGWHLPGTSKIWPWGPSQKRAARCRGCFHPTSEPGFQFSERLCFHPKRCCLLLFDLNILKDNRKQMKYISVLILRRESFGRLPGAAGWIRRARMATFIWVTSTPI